MLKLDDTRWDELHGAHRVPYDPRPALARLEVEATPESAWEELWENLHHEGDVGEASYAAVPHLVRIARSRNIRDWNLFALMGTIELERESQENPALPDWLQESYDRAWERLFELARTELAEAADSVTLRCLLAAIAIAKGDHRRGRVLLEFDDEELDEIIGEHEIVADFDD